MPQSVRTTGVTPTSVSPALGQRARGGALSIKQHWRHCARMEAAALLPSFPHLARRAGGQCDEDSEASELPDRLAAFFEKHDPAAAHTSEDLASRYADDFETLNNLLQYTYGVCLPQPGSGRDAAKALKLPKILAAQFRARSCDPLAGLDTVRAHAARELSVLRSCEPIPSRHLKGPFPRSLGIFPVARSRRGPLVGALNLFLFVLPKP